MPAKVRVANTKHLREMWDAGLSVRAIAERLGVSARTVKRRVSLFGYPDRKQDSDRSPETVQIPKHVRRYAKVQLEPSGSVRQIAPVSLPREPWHA